MKKLLLSLAFVLTSICAFSQVKVSINYLDVDVVFKRCIMKGDLAYVDFIMTNNTGKDIKTTPSWGCRMDGVIKEFSAYDDEGNVYKCERYDKAVGKIQSFTIGGDTYSGSHLTGNDESTFIPSGIPIKCRVVLSKVDGYATRFSLLRVTFKYFGQNSDSVLIEFKDIPFVRQ